MNNCFGCVHWKYVADSINNEAIIQKFQNMKSCKKKFLNLMYLCGFYSSSSSSFFFFWCDVSFIFIKKCLFKFLNDLPKEYS